MVMQRLLVVYLLAACLAAADAITANVSQSVAPILEAAKPLLLQKHPELTLSISGTTSPASIKAVVSGEAQLGGIVRALKADELGACPELQAVPYARDGLALVVNAANPVAGLTLAQAKDLFTGTITSWKALGGNDDPILIVGRTEANALNEFLEQKLGLEHLAEGRTMAFKAKGAAAFTETRFPVTGTHKDALAQVLLKSNAFSFIPLGLAQENRKKGGAIRILTLDGCAPDAAGIASGTYLLGRTLYLVTKGPPGGVVKDIIDLVLSPEGQALVAERGSFPIK